jgi:hypothetical protein
MDHKRFDKLIAQYEKDTPDLTNTDLITGDTTTYKQGANEIHPAFIEIVAMGKDALSALHQELGSGWGPITMAWHILGNEAPEVPNEARGNFEAVNAIYRAWGDKQNYGPPSSAPKDISQ